MYINNMVAKLDIYKQGEITLKYLGKRKGAHCYEPCIEGDIQWLRSLVSVTVCQLGPPLFNKQDLSQVWLKRSYLASDEEFEP